MSGKLEQYLDAAERPNTRASYASAVRHFEVEGGGRLPSSAVAIAQYVADFAATLSPNTLRQRVVALGRWHVEHGFVDPTRDPLVRKTLRGVRAVHGTREKQAVPLQIEQLAAVVSALEQRLHGAQKRKNRVGELRACRDRALLLLGFWRAFRGDELVSLYVEHLTLDLREGMTVFLPRTKGDRANTGTTFTVPALSRLCPVAAVAAWIDVAQLTVGPVFRRITADGHVGTKPLHRKSLDELLRRILGTDGVIQASVFTPHSLRRGLASWATANGWDVKTLMEYVGWRDVGSALRYVNASTSDRERVEAGLAKLPATPIVPKAPERIRLEVQLTLQPYGSRYGLRAARKSIEATCLARFGGQRMDKDGSRFQIWLDANEATLDERVADVLEELQLIASSNNCYLEASLRRPETSQHWD